jgi:hypothetical protein
MIPENKAQDLINQFDFIPLGHENVEPNDIHKQCALIVIDEIIDEWNKISDLKSILYITDNLVTVVDKICYWQEIKREIEKL